MHVLKASLCADSQQDAYEIHRRWISCPSDESRQLLYGMGEILYTLQMNYYFTRCSILRRRSVLLIFLFNLLTVICHYFKWISHLDQSLAYSVQYRPLILLYTHNYSIKTRDNICRGTRNGGHVVHFHSCPKKCEFSCRIEDFHQRSPAAVLFFSEDFSWPFKLSDRNRTSTQQRWIFWSWEAPIHHPEYTRSTQLTFNWFVRSFVPFTPIFQLIQDDDVSGRF